MSYKVLSQLSKYKDKLVFCRFEDPDEKITQAFNLRKLPALAGILAPPAGGEDVQNLRQFTYPGKLTYHEIEQQLNSLLQEIGMSTERNEKRKAKELVEVTASNFDNICRDHKKICGIAFLNAQTSPDYEIDNHNKYISMMEEIQKNSDPAHINYMWVNATCHVSFGM